MNGDTVFKCGSQYKVFERSSITWGKREVEVCVEKRVKGQGKDFDKVFVCCVSSMPGHLFRALSRLPQLKALQLLGLYFPEGSYQGTPHQTSRGFGDLIYEMKRRNPLRGSLPYYFEK